ncbi:MAG TPA: hypothetical protein VHV29_00285 [Terriglobales bacterium]|nr:hypothetical protein [Terriglobales bacterium]
MTLASPDIIDPVVYLNGRGTYYSMTQMEVAYRYAGPPTENAMRAVDNMREVYGIRRVSFNEKLNTVRVEYDASRFKEPVVANLLRRAGVDILERLALA